MPGLGKPRSYRLESTVREAMVTALGKAKT